MKKPFPLRKLIPIYIFVLFGCISTAMLSSRAVTVMVQSPYAVERTRIIVDAGHGGIDGGATACNGATESHLNLAIALRLRDLLHLLGYDTVMIRSTDTSVYTEGNTIAAQKVSDLKERVRIANETKNGILISIHQNTFPDGRYSGAQMFYAPDSKQLAEHLQKCFLRTVNPGSTRRPKSSEGIYLMQNIKCPGILIECGFISNPEEAAKLCSEKYQKQLAMVVTCGLADYISR